MITKALNKAFQLHKEQVRKGTNVPYIVHPLDVAKILMYETDDEELICAGILHDTLEDTNYTREELREDFGDKVYSIVDFCSEPGNNNQTTEKEETASWKQRKSHSINLIKDATEEELIVLIADKFSNLQSIKDDLDLIGDKIWDRFNASYEDIKWYYQSLRDETKKKIPNRRILKLFDKLVNEVC